jgi:hypothetical protein
MRPDTPWWQSSQLPTVLLLTGIAAGPSGLNLMPGTALRLLDPVVAISIMALAILVALRRSSVSADVAAVVILGLLTITLDPRSFESHALISRLMRTAEATAAATVCGTAGFLLLSGTASPTERRVTGLAVLLVLAGIADFTSTLAVPAGVVAGIIWRRLSAGSTALADDLEYVYRAVAAGMLGLVGVQLQVTVATSLIAVGCVALMVGHRHVSRWIPAAPGMLILSLGIDLTRGVDEAFAPLVDGVALGIIAAQLIAYATERETLGTLAGVES